jgi:hypothetical protein
MSESIQVGDKVRINERYGQDLGDLGINTVGTEFEVTDVVYADYGYGYGDHFVVGDPQDWCIWAAHFEKVTDDE